MVVPCRRSSLFGKMPSFFWHFISGRQMHHPRSNTIVLVLQSRDAVNPHLLFTKLLFPSAFISPQTAVLQQKQAGSLDQTSSDLSILFKAIPSRKKAFTVLTKIDVYQGSTLSSQHARILTCRESRLCIRVGVELMRRKRFHKQLKFLDNHVPSH